MPGDARDFNNTETRDVEQVSSKFTETGPCFKNVKLRRTSDVGNEDEEMLEHQQKAGKKMDTIRK